MFSVSSSDSHKHQRALDSLVFRGGSSRGNTLSINYLDLASPMASVGGRADRDDRDIRGSRANRDDQDSHSHPSRRTSPSPSTSRKRSRSKSGSSSVLLASRVRKETTSDGESANVCMVKRSNVHELRGWMKNCMDSKSENFTLRCSYKQSFEGNFESMLPELDPALVRKWLRNIGDTSDNPKIKDFWEKNLFFIQRKLKDVFEPLIYLLCSVPEGHDAELCIRTVTRLLGHVFPTSPKYVVQTLFATWPQSFPIRWLILYCSLHETIVISLGKKFISAMDKEVDIDAKMNKIGRLGGHHSSRRGNAFSRKGDCHSGGGTSNHPKPNWNWGKATAAATAWETTKRLSFQSFYRQVCRPFFFHS